MGMSASPQGISLDQAPPSPPDLSGAQSQMSGTMGQGADASGSAVLQSAVQQAMQIEQGLQSLGSILPSFAPIAQQLVQVLRMGIARSLQEVSGGGLGTGAPAVQGAGSSMSQPVPGVM